MSELAAPQIDGRCILCGREPGSETYWTPEIVRCPCGLLVYTDQRRARRPDELYGRDFFEGREAYHDYQAERAVIRRSPGQDCR